MSTATVRIINSRYWASGTVMALLLMAAFVFSLISQSQFGLSFDDLWLTLSAPDPASLNQQVILSLRLPRSLVACLIGVNLGIAGALMQGLTRNPLASPTLFAINSGAACLMALSSIGLGLFSDLPIELITFIGAFIGGSLVLWLGGGLSSQLNPLRLILAGIAINALFSSFTRAVLIIADDKAYSLLHWLSGSLSEIDWASWSQLWPVSLVAMVLALTTCRGLNLASLGDQSAASLGLNVLNLRLRVCCAILVLTAISVTLAGPIVFVGLIAPHICRRLFNHNHFLVVPLSGLIGACIVSVADLLSRFVVPQAETPVGIITALIGTPIFIYLALKEPAS